MLAQRDGPAIEEVTEQGLSHVVGCTVVAVQLSDDLIERLCGGIGEHRPPRETRGSAATTFVSGGTAAKIRPGARASTVICWPG